VDAALGAPRQGAQQQRIMAKVPPVAAGHERAGNVAETAKKCRARLSANASLVDVLLAGARAAKAGEAAAATAGEHFAKELQKASVDEGCTELKASLETTARELEKIQDLRRTMLVRSHSSHIFFRLTTLRVASWAPQCSYAIVPRPPRSLLCTPADDPHEIRRHCAPQAL